MDAKVFEFINGFAGKNYFLDELGIFFGVWLIFILGAVVILLAFNKKYFWYAILAIVSSVIGRLAIVEVIKEIVNRPRPYEVLPVHQLIVDTEKGMSFSSGHAVILFCIAFSFAGTKFYYPFLILVTLGSIARIFIGVHYPLDILASAIIAYLVVWCLNQFFQKKKAL